jgi:hypothetical protein
MRTSLVLVAALGCSPRPAPVEPAPAAAPPAAPAAPAVAPVVDEPIMHRVQAGTRDASGWYPAHSTNGKFSVSLPAPFNDFEMNTHDKDTGTPVKLHAVGSPGPDGVKYVATCLTKLKPDVLNTLPAQLAPGQPVRKLTVAGKPAIEFSVADQSMSARVIDLGATVCLLTVEAQDKAQLAVPPPANVQRMFDSFKLD